MKSVPIYNVEMTSIDGSAKDKIKVTGTNMPNFTVVKRPDMNKPKRTFEHTKDKRFHMKKDHEYLIDLIVGDNTFSRMKTEKVHKGKPGEPAVEETTLGWIIHGGDLPNDKCMYCRDVSDYHMLYSLDILGVEELKEDDQLDVYVEFNESIIPDDDGMLQVNVPLPGAQLTETNETQSKKRLRSVMRNLDQDPALKAASFQAETVSSWSYPSA